MRQAFTRASTEAVQLREEKEALLAKVSGLKMSIHTNEILDDLIEPMAGKVFWFMCLYCVGVGLLVVASASWSVQSGRGALSDGVLKLLVGSTAVTVIGLVGTIVAGIFANARRRSN